ncbi:uncharacterized protein ACMZJ9_007577 [Mantella aurantiaca]
MDRVCALALCLLLSLCSARSPPKLPILTPLNCNETNSQVGLAVDLINEDREDGFIIKPTRTKSIFEQKLSNVPGGSVYYIDIEVKETKCSVLSSIKWKDCEEQTSFHEEVTGQCKGIMYIARPWRILKILHYNCTLGTVSSSTIVSRCPDCPVIVRDITPNIKAKVDSLVVKFNNLAAPNNNQTHHFKLDEIERVRTQWVFGQSYFIYFTIKETDCLKTQENVVLENCNFLKDHQAHVGFCTGNTYTKPDKSDEYVVSCEIYNPRDDDHHHHHQKHIPCDHRKEGGQVEKVKDNVEQSEAGAGEVGPTEVAPGEAGQSEKCQLGKGKHFAGDRSCKHPCPHDPRYHRHPGHHHHHHSGHHHHHPGHHHHHHHHHQQDCQNHSHPHDPDHHHPHHHGHHNHTSPEHGSSSEESTDNQSFKRTKGSVHVYYLDKDTPSPPVPTIVRLPTPGKLMLETADFPNEPSPLNPEMMSQTPPYAFRPIIVIGGVVWRIEFRILRAIKIILSQAPPMCDE